MAIDYNAMRGKFLDADTGQVQPPMEVVEGILAPLWEDCKRPGTQQKRCIGCRVRVGIGPTSQELLRHDPETAIFCQECFERHQAERSVETGK